MTGKKGKLSFSKSERLRKNPEFVRVQRQGKRFNSKHFILIVAPLDIKTPLKSGKKQKQSGIESNNKVARVKLGVTITNKVEPSSVKRNRVKRIVREAFRHLKEQCVAGIAISIIAKSGSIELGSLEVRKQLYAALKFNGFIQ